MMVNSTGDKGKKGGKEEWGRKMAGKNEEKNEKNDRLSVAA
jgi:hypothetical protein